ncbi:hypothetical protein HNP88_000382 [Methanococcus maripaludis]|uniref:Transcriptional regulator n=1 Tax=Methanococcus maripaludis TaxID=39152 RepID=A0A7J9NN66_METMI|nr:hypothetical protein [Methanococcus maripaludis]MBA2846198.1 hypothetical protein [Methanococcus maripaludis]
MKPSEKEVFELFLVNQIVTAPIAELLTKYKLDSCKRALLGLKEMGLITLAEGKAGYYIPTEKGETELKKVEL